MIPCSYWALACVAVLPSCVTSYLVSVRQARGLPVVSLFPHPASFRFHLAMDTLAFGYILPTTGRIRDFHPLETCAAGRTTNKASDLDRRSDAFFRLFRNNGGRAAGSGFEGTCVRMIYLTERDFYSVIARQSRLQIAVFHNSIQNRVTNAILLRDIK